MQPFLKHRLQYATIPVYSPSTSSVIFTFKVDCNETPTRSALCLPSDPRRNLSAYVVISSTHTQRCYLLSSCSGVDEGTGVGWLSGHPATIYIGKGGGEVNSIKSHNLSRPYYVFILKGSSDVGRGRHAIRDLDPGITTSLHTIEHRRTLLNITIHHCIPTHVIAHHRTPIHTTATPLLTIAHNCTPLQGFEECDFLQSTNYLMIRPK